MTAERIEIVRPDDWHLHLRDGAMLHTVVGFSAAVFGRAIVMPNLVPPVRIPAEAEAYRARIEAALPAGHPFAPLMTAYMTDNAEPDDIRSGFENGAFHAVKLYPAGATTNSAFGVTRMEAIRPVLAEMERIGMPLLVHGEVVDPEVDVFDREAVYIERVLDPMRRDFPGLKVVLEHVTTAEAVDYVRAAEDGLGATITPHHLMINRNAIFRGGIRPHMYCLPVAKQERHRLALRAAATSGDSRFFLGTDSAPHPRRDKETDCGCAGIFNAPNALQCVAQVFDEEGALDRLEGFVSRAGAEFYRMEPNSDRIVLEKGVVSETPREAVGVADHAIRVFEPDTPISWRIVSGLR
ncbi:MAG: dihydroorotase [Defluviicoccus sp.]|nr:dihydroorotase [Defluviicoccus sp.]